MLNNNGLKVLVCALSFSLFSASVLVHDAQAIEKIIQEIAPPADSYSMQEAIDRALVESPKLEAASARVEASEYDVKSAYGALFPTVSANVGATRMDVRSWNSNALLKMVLPAAAALPNTSVADINATNFSWSIVASQPLFTGFALLNSIDQAKLAKESQELQYENANLQLVSAVQTSFIEFLRFEDMIKSTERAIDRAKEQLALTTAAYEVGLRPHLEVLQAQVDLASLENTLLQVKNRREVFRASLQALLVIPTTSSTDFTGSLKVVPFDRTLEECINIAMENRPELKLGRLSVGMAETGKKLVNSAYYPKVMLQASYNETGDMYKNPGDSRAFSIGIVAQWDIFNGGRRYNASKKADLQISEARYSLVDSMTGIASGVKALYLTAQEAKKRITVTEQSVARAFESYTAAQARYELGVGTNLDLLLAQSALSNEEASHTSALADYLLAISQLHTAMGESYKLPL